MKFEKIEQYRQQTEAYLQRQRELIARRDSALEEYQALKAEYEKVLRESLVSGKDADPQLDELSDKISQAEKVYERRKREYDIASTIHKFEISKEDVVKSWREEFFPKFKAEKFDPAAEALLQAKLAYFDAYLHYKKVVDEYDDIKRDVLLTLSPGDGGATYRYKLGDIDFHIGMKPTCITSKKPICTI